MLVTDELGGKCDKNVPTCTYLFTKRINVRGSFPDRTHNRTYSWAMYHDHEAKRSWNIALSAPALLGWEWDGMVGLMYLCFALSMGGSECTCVSHSECIMRGETGGITDQSTWCMHTWMLHEGSLYSRASSHTFTQNALEDKKSSSDEITLGKKPSRKQLGDVDYVVRKNWFALWNFGIVKVKRLYVRSAHKWVYGTNTHNVWSKLSATGTFISCHILTMRYLKSSPFQEHFYFDILPNWHTVQIMWKFSMFFFI